MGEIKVINYINVDGEDVLFDSLPEEKRRRIAEAIQEQLGVEVDRRRIELGKPIKQVGTYPVAVSIYREIKGTVSVNVDGEFVGDAEMDSESVETVEEVAADIEAADEAVEAAGEAEAAAEAAVAADAEAEQA